MKNSAEYLLCYDITCPKRLRRVHKCVRSYGHRMQDSVYYLRLTPTALRQLSAEIERLISKSEDDVRAYPLVAGAAILWAGLRPDADGIMDFSMPALRLQADEGLLWVA